MPQVAAQGHWVNAFDLASQYLNRLGWPNNPQTQRAFAAWFMAESRRSGNDVYVVGNNPLNITTGASGNYRLVGSHRIAVFSSPESGVGAFGSLISSSGHNYPGIKAAFKSGSGTAAIAAIINSGWVPGGNGPSYWHTVGHGKRTNLVQDIFNGLPGGGSSAVLPPGGGGSSGNPPNTNLAAWGGLVSYPVGHIFSEADVNDIINKMNAAGWFDAALGGTTARDLTRGILMQEVGQPWNKALQDRLQAKFLNASVLAGHDINPIAVAGDAATSLFNNVVGFVGGVVVGAGAIIVGGIMGLFGIYLITKEATSTTGAGESIVSPVPIFIREKTA